LCIHDKKNFGFFVMPDDSRNGDLETLCLDTVQGRPLEQQSEAYLRGVPNASNLDAMSKRKTQVYLAGINADLCRGPGLGFKRGHFDDSHVVLNPLKQFLSAFLIPPP